MVVEIKRFGLILTSRPAGKEAFLAARAYVLPKETKEITLDFLGVEVLSPSWADEFISGLNNLYKGLKIKYQNTNNSSVKATLEILEQAN